MTSGFLAQSLEESYRYVDECPEGFLGPLLKLTFGSLEARIQEVNRWSKSLLNGTLPPVSGFIPPAIEQPARLALESLDLAKFCKDQPELRDQILRDVVRSWTNSEQEFQAELIRELEALAKLTRERLQQSENQLAQEEKRKERKVELDSKLMDRLRKQAEEASIRKLSTRDQRILSDWEEKVRAWSEISDVFGDLGELLGRGWDMSQNVLKMTGWQDLLKLRALIEKLPELREIIRTLGRFEDSRSGEAVSEMIFQPVRRLEEELREIKIPNIPPIVSGVERGGDISRMLPGEAVFLGHPKLRMLWHARRAERALMIYRVEGTDWESYLIEKETQESIEQKRPRPERGPIIAIIDTSGSMHGLPERVAKAVILEALRTAHAEKRKCFAYTFSGPGEIDEHELELSSNGISSLLRFLGGSFGGGTDPSGPILRVTEKLGSGQWAKSDVVIVSDGEWPTPDYVFQQVSKAKESGTRFHGIQIGNWGETGLHSICDPVHIFDNWVNVVDPNQPQEFAN
jgi:uncharacterized protein with von Willebrand factor type A (vWA) domain